MGTCMLNRIDSYLVCSYTSTLPLRVFYCFVYCNFFNLHLDMVCQVAFVWLGGTNRKLNDKPRQVTLITMSLSRLLQDANKHE